MVPARNPYSYPIISDSDRVRHQQSDASRGGGFEAALQMDINNANERTAHANQARDARNGVNVVTGRGDWPASTTTPRLTEATSIFGEGSTECRTGVPMSLDFVTSDESTLYSGSLPHGGTLIDSGNVKPWVSRTKIEMYFGNPGIRDSAKLGPCCVTVLNDILAHHANHTHHSPEAARRALRQDLLANVSKEIRPLLVAYDPDGPWMGLV